MNKWILYFSRLFSVAAAAAVARIVDAEMLTIARLAKCQKYFWLFGYTCAIPSAWLRLTVHPYTWETFTSLRTLCTGCVCIWRRIAWRKEASGDVCSCNFGGDMRQYREFSARKTAFIQLRGVFSRNYMKPSMDCNWNLLHQIQSIESSNDFFLNGGASPRANRPNGIRESDE